MPSPSPHDAPSSDAELAATLALIEPIAGWLTDGQARRLWERARAVPVGGRIVEIGSYQGRSTVVLARAAAPGVEVVAIDPHAGTDRGPQELRVAAELGEADHEAFLANLVAAGVEGRVRHVRRFSGDALGEVDDPIDLLYVDGAHRFGPARDDLRRWGTRVRPGGALLVHDSWSSIGVTLALLVELTFGGRWRYRGRSRSLADYVAEPVRGRARLANTARQLAELPWFVRNVAIKVLLTLRLRPLTRLLGDRDGAWPY